MIRNIVFDMGRVLVGYDAGRVCSHYMRDGEQKRNVCTSVFVSPEWLMLDMGVISEEEALTRMQERLDTGYEKDMAALCLEHWHEYNMWPIESMGELVRELKEAGYGIYLCSNASLRLLDCCRIIPAIDYFDGVLFSAEVKCIKPQKEIYHHLFERFHLKPRECFFIDDLMINIKGAADCGMPGYCYGDGDEGALRAALFRLSRKTGQDMRSHCADGE